MKSALVCPQCVRVLGDLPTVGALGITQGRRVGTAPAPAVLVPIREAVDRGMEARDFVGEVFCGGSLLVPIASIFSSSAH
jgi:hypothetical protein